MKTILSTLMLLMVTLAHGQVSKLNEIFDRYQEAKGVTSIKIGKPMFNMINNLKVGDEKMDQIKPLLTKINSIKMLIVEGDAHSRISEEVKIAFSGIHYEELMVIHSDGDRIKFLAENTDSNVLNNLLLNISSDGDTIFMILEGKIDYDDLNNLIQEK